MTLEAAKEIGEHLIASLACNGYSDTALAEYHRIAVEAITELINQADDGR